MSKQTERTLQIALVDDRSLNLQGWLAALEPICGQQAELSTFQSVDALEEALADGFRPDILFTDYFIEDRNGFEVMDMIRDRFGNSVYLIAHSAEAWANDLMLQAGANEALAKFEDQHPSTTVDERFRCFDDVSDLVDKI